jgi:TonB-linked SusC/RagA family outer membrane protein
MLKKFFACFRRRERPILLLFLLLSSSVIFAQQKRLITGVVTTESNFPLQNVSVLVKGQGTGTTTNEKGEYSLDVPANGVVVFSIIGYEDKQLNLGKTNTLNVVLVSRTSSLGDVVVIGYGTQKRKDLTGAVTSVNLSKTGELPMVAVDQILSGRASNVQINQSSGQAGAGSNIRIRGGNSLIGTNQPLFVIDGFPIISDNDAFAAGNVQGLTNGASGNPSQQNSNGALNWLNPSDIQSIEVLKDASATAIYGSRGGNGVIIITTKKGRKGVPRLNLDVSAGISQLNKSKIKLMNGSQYAEYNNLFNIHNGNRAIYVDTIIGGKHFPLPSQVGAGTNWVDAVTGNGAYNNYSLTFSGGTEALFSGSVDYLKQGTPLLNSQFNRLTARLDVQSDLTKWLSLDNNIIFSNSTIDNSPSDVRDVQKFGMWEAALFANPAEPVYKADGTLNYNGGDPSNAKIPGISYSPVALGTDVLNKATASTFLDNLALKFNLAKGLTFDTRGSIFNNDLLRDIYYNSQSTFNGYQVGGLGGKNTNTATIYLLEAFGTYNKNFGNNVLNAIAGYSFQESNYRVVNSGASGFPNDDLKNENLAAGSTQYPTITYRTKDLLSSYYVRINDIFLDKYILTFTARYDGSSKFGSSNQWAFFPSGAFSWKINEEEFMKNNNLFSDLKLRVSYGLSGNQAISSLQSKSLLAFNNYPLGGVLQTGAYPAVLGNSDLKWETTKQFNAGLDFGFMKQRLTGSINYYVKNTDDLLQQLVIPANSGFTSIYTNVGSISNKGIELELHYAVINNQSFKWDMDFNISHNVQTLTNLGLPGSDTLLVPFYPVGGSAAYVSLIKGRPVGEFYGYVNGGIYKTQDEVDKSAHMQGAAPGSRIFKDLNGDGVINDLDRTVIGNPNPDFIFGFNNSFSYKGFDLTFLIQGSVGGQAYNLSDYLQRRLGNLSEAANDYWTPTNPNAKYTAPGDVIGIDNHNSFSVSSASYVRLKSVNLGYNFNVEKVKFVKSVRLYGSASNLITITNYQGYDPEINSFAQSNLFRNIDVLTVPSFKTYIIGLNIGF